VCGVVQLISEHNFCNLYKLDPANQLTSFQQHILCADISPLGSGNMHVFDLVSTVFLYNQVWHIMVVLLLTGAWFELPSVISTLLNVDLSMPSMHLEDKELQLLVTCKLEY
jgi:tRNA U38,U39,U40 pseudouridine synthase TruA